MCSRQDLDASEGRTKMVKVLSGNGIQSNKTVQSRSGVKVEPRTTAINPAGVSQRDVSTAFRKENVEMGRGYEPAKKSTIWANRPGSGYAQTHERPN